MILYYLRHGEKGEHKISYFKNLTEKGRKESRLIGNLIKHIHFDVVFISSYLRTRETFLELPIKYDKLEVSSDFVEIKKENNNVSKFLKKLKSLPENYVCLMVGHGNFQRYLLSQILKIPFKKCSAFIFNTASLSKYWIGKDDKILYLNFTYDLCKDNL